ncbi:QueT transporter family protein [Clostridium sp. Cult3]|uniref:QueT transporter family protein n=1 Tax=Clostridium sp. Cult3 TaxID=2079004 RepID=UPI001F26D30C|nr:QueT transporter family protein [Clostridium sp. Cult3]
MNTNRLVKAGIIAALYVVLTYALPSLAYGPLQFRFSEILTLLAYIDPFYVLPLTLGNALANIGSPFGIIDVVYGTFLSFLALYSMSKTKNIYIASLWPAVFNAFIGLEIYLLSETPVNFFIVAGQIALSEFIIVSLIGVPIFKIMEKNDYIMDILKNN